MKFIDVPGRVLRKYFVFEGRASRSEYWWWFLITCAIEFVLQLFIPVLAIIVILVLASPTIAVTARRLHDQNRSGWWQLIALIPLIGWILLELSCIRKGTLGPNDYGEDPVESQP